MTIWITPPSRRCCRRLSAWSRRWAWVRICATGDDPGDNRRAGLEPVGAYQRCADGTCSARAPFFRAALSVTRPCGELYVCHPKAKGLLQRRLRLRPALQGYWRAVWRSGLSHYGKRAVRPDWKYIHMHPAETAQASADLNAGRSYRDITGVLCWRNIPERSTDPAGESQQG